MQLSELPKITKTKKKRLGQGHGSGRGKTSGRGTKGQKARRDIPMTRYSGGSLAFVKSLPFLRGKSRNKSLKGKPVILNVKDLESLPKNTLVDVKALVSHHLVNESDVKVWGIKLLGDGNISIPLTIKIPFSEGARTKIEKAGGKIEPIHE